MPLLVVAQRAGRVSVTWLATGWEQRRRAERLINMIAANTNRLFLLGVILAVAGISCGGSGYSDDDYIAPIGPLGGEFELFGSNSRVELRVGESRVITVTLNSVGEKPGIWTLDPESAAITLTQGIEITNVVPSEIDFTDDRSVSFEVELSVPAAAVPGSGGSMQFRYVGPDPEDPDRRASFGVVSSSVSIVANDATLGPSAASESIGASGDGVTFDPLANDAAGDAPLDPSSLTIVSAPSGPGTLMITGDTQLTYVPGSTEGERAVYQICDTSDLCSTADIWLWEQSDR